MMLNDDVMVLNDDVELLHQRLSKLAVSDPRNARQDITEMLDTNDGRLDAFLERISLPGEGRLRQLVANAVRQRPEKEHVIPYLAAWQETEADEFTRSAIDAALDGTTRPPRIREATSPVPPEYIQAYRYVADRLCHRVRNALVSPGTMISLLERKLVPELHGPEADEIISLMNRLKQGFSCVSRLVEFDVGDEYFTWRNVHLIDWIENMHRRFVATNEPVNLTIDEPLRLQAPRILANNHLLETLFGNLWTNAVQNASSPCAIRLEGAVQNGKITIVVDDNGPGFSASARNNLFVDAYSTNGLGRGRGLLEACDAVRQLHGNIQIIEYHGTLRLRITFSEAAPCPIPEKYTRSSSKMKLLS